MKIRHEKKVVKKKTVFVREKRVNGSRIGSKKRDKKGPKYWMNHTVCPFK